jgi:hypothetical protein
MGVPQVFGRPPWKIVKCHFPFFDRQSWLDRKSEDEVVGGNVQGSIILSIRFTPEDSTS